MKYSLITLPISVVLASYGQNVLAGHHQGYQSQGCYNPCQPWAVTYRPPVKPKPVRHVKRPVPVRHYVQQARPCDVQVNRTIIRTTRKVTTVRRVVTQVVPVYPVYSERIVPTPVQEYTPTYAVFGEVNIGFGGGQGYGGYGYGGHKGGHRGHGAWSGGGNSNMHVGMGSGHRGHRGHGAWSGGGNSNMHVGMGGGHRGHGGWSGGSQGGWWGGSGSNAHAGNTNV